MIDSVVIVGPTRAFRSFPPCVRRVQIRPGDGVYLKLVQGAGDAAWSRPVLLSPADSARA